MPTPQTAIRWMCAPGCKVFIVKLSLKDVSHDHVVDMRAKAFDLVVGSRRMHPVRQQNDVTVFLQVPPDRGAGEAQMPDGARREKTAAARILRRRRVPAEREGRARNGFVAREELSDDGRGKQRIPAGQAFAQPQQKTVDVLGVREKPGVPGDAAHRVGVVVVHLAADDALAPRAVLGRRDHLVDRLEPPRAQLREIDERRRAQPDRLEDLVVAVAVERPAGDLLDGLAEENVAEVAVKRLGARHAQHLFAVNLLEDEVLGGAAGDEIDLSRLLIANDLLEIRLPRGQTGGMRKELAKSYVYFPEHAEIGKEARHAVVEADFFFAHEQHDRRRGGERLDAEARSKIISGRIGVFSGTSERAPKAAWQRISSPFAASTTAPGKTPSARASLNASSTA